MTHYIRRGDMFALTSGANADVTTELPLGTYRVDYNNELKFHVVRIDDLDAPDRIYGDVEQRADRALQTYMQRPGNTGILATGEKGSGKTMLMRLIACKAQGLGMPTLVINEQYGGDEFNAFVQAIHQPAVFLFDEIDKVYGPAENHYGNDVPGKKQDELLTLLDGVYMGKKLFLLTGNKASKISKHMLNRPGRIFYHFRYDGLDEAIVRQYVAEQLKNQDHGPNIQIVVDGVDNFSFDMLQALVEEMNRYGEDAQTAVRHMNIRPEDSEFVYYRVTAVKDGKTRKAWQQGAGNPMTNEVTHARVETDERDMDGDTISSLVSFTPKDFVGRHDGLMIFQKDGYVIQFRRDRRREHVF